MDKKESRDEYNRLSAVVREVINEWDPYSLIEGGAPSNEFEHEVASLTAPISRIKTEDELIGIISRVFSDSFEPEHFTQENCRNVGSKLFDRLKNEGLL